MKPVPVSFVFDDGFKKSGLRVAEIFEAHHLRATFAVLAEPDGFMKDFPKGDFSLWNELLKRGHEIHPHGYDHSDLSKLSHEEAVEKIDQCFAVFSEQLDGFEAGESVYHLTYNRSTPAVEHYLLDRVKAIRTTGADGAVSDGLNGPEDLRARTFKCAWHGPDCCDEHLFLCLKNAAASRAAHFCYMLHGLNEEGWGPISEQGLVRALEFVSSTPELTYQPIGQTGEQLNG